MPSSSPPTTRGSGWPRSRRWPATCPFSRLLSASPHTPWPASPAVSAPTSTPRSGGRWPNLIWTHGILGWPARRGPRRSRRRGWRRGRGRAAGGGSAARQRGAGDPLRLAHEEELQREREAKEKAIKAAEARLGE